LQARDDYFTFAAAIFSATQRHRRKKESSMQKIKLLWS